MELSAKTIAEYLKGDIEGDAEVMVNMLARIEEGKPGNVCFLANPKYEKHLYTTKASIVLVNRSFNLTEKVKPTLIRVDNAYESVASLLELYNTYSFDRKGRSGNGRPISTPYHLSILTSEFFSLNSSIASSSPANL